MKVMLVQAKPRTGLLCYNFKLIKKYYSQACEAKVDLCFFPELITTGYFCEDLFNKESFITKIHEQINYLTPFIAKVALVISTPYKENNKLYNKILVIQDGRIIGTTSKRHLPNYSVFDEKRYFSPGTSNLIELNGYKIGIPICEDIWFDDVCLQLKKAGAELFLVPNASPYEKGKFIKRIEILKQRFQETNIPFIYCNQATAQDGIVFDGRSILYDGTLKIVGSTYKEDVAIIELRKNVLISNKSYKDLLSIEDEIYGAMVFGLKEYLANNNIIKVIVGLSGGIDSALVTAIAVDAIGPKNVKAIMMPSKYTSKESLEDAAQVALLLKVDYQVISIEQMINPIQSSIGNISDLARENMQARIRGLILMTIANSIGSIVLTTGNKSENATGYATLYGDMCGAFNPIKDLYKTEVFTISEFRNNNIPLSINCSNKSYPVMPNRILTKAPSAELKANQKDSDYLPEYKLLDKILENYIENDFGIEEIIAMGMDKNTVEKVVNLVLGSEFKRRQSAPGVKLSSTNLEKDRRYPITL